MVIRLITNKEAKFLYISFSILRYFIVYLLGKNQEIGEGKFRYVNRLRVKVHTAWKRKDAQQVGTVSEQCGLVFSGNALVDLGVGGGGAVNNFAFKDAKPSIGLIRSQEHLYSVHSSDTTRYQAEKSKKFEYSPSCSAVHEQFVDLVSSN